MVGEVEKKKRYEEQEGKEMQSIGQEKEKKK